MSPATPTVSTIVLAPTIATSVTSITASIATTSTPIPSCDEIDPTSAAKITSPTLELVHTNITSSSVLNVSSPEVVQGIVFGGDQFTALDSGDLSRYEIGDFTVKSRGGRTIRPTQKVQDMN